MKKIFFICWFMLIAISVYCCVNDNKLSVSLLPENKIIRIIKSNLNNKSIDSKIGDIVQGIPLKIIDTSYTQFYPGIVRTIKLYYSANIFVELFIDYSKITYDKTLAGIPFLLNNYFKYNVKGVRVIQNGKQIKKYGICKEIKQR